MKKPIITVLALVMALALTACGGKNESGQGERQNVLRVGVECAFAPYNWEEDEASESNAAISNHAGFYAEGYDVQIAKLVAARMGVELEIVKLPWDGLLEGLNQGQVDAVFSGMVDSAEHKQAAAFSELYVLHPTEYGVMVRGDSPFAAAAVPSDFAGASLMGKRARSWTRSSTRSRASTMSRRWTRSPI